MPDTTAWRLMESAPRDETEFLSKDCDGWVDVVAWQGDCSGWPWLDSEPGFFRRYRGAWDLYDGFAPQEVEPVQWAPIPE